ncbi:tail protein [Citrobacter phage IME-CF2]|uniref:LysM domain-containing protein n=4 Tax=Pseudotevenvirus TaxID=2842979 RepID=A0A1B1IXQ7_9CAUD|nr:tail protein [Citrobacter phage IME-CF2]YP_009285559.1 tail protein [Citrobacter phage vB_CfrM_CfP1]YP_238996.1 tail protein [Escherichia phage RB43]CCK73868.1 protein of unknown function [Pseudotevenvirus RB43]AAX78542.1 hypothetical protein RB43ORF020c [Escherichia phage RB43]AKR16017.1 hypothetical protein [Citrobacter phage IME-CF2]ANS06110.1 hypothetical protein ABCD_0021 [Citrobacter phage vB_CfrM_CfP1]CCL97485.1 protein of unknown function [Pseudotevenvirus RB43]
MIKLTFAGISVRAKTLDEAKVQMFDRVMNPALITTEYGEYIVQPGDTMYSIAYNLYGCGERWRTIAKLNRDTVKNASHILPGMVLKLPQMTEL